MAFKNDIDLQGMLGLLSKEVKDPYYEEYDKYMEETYPQYWND